MAKASSQTTRWTLIVRAQGSGAEARAALGELLTRYERFVLWLIRRNGHPPDTNPEDLKQEFWEGIVRRGDIGKLDPERGRFRTWLSVAVRRFTANEWDKWNAASAGRKQTAAALFEAFQRSTPEDELSLRRFAEDTIVHVLETQRAEARDKKRFDDIARFLVGPGMDLVALAPYARSLGLKPMTLGKAISEARARNIELVRAAIEDTLVLDDDASEQSNEARRAEARRAVDAELNELLRCFVEPGQAGVILGPS